MARKSYFIPDLIRYLFFSRRKRYYAEIAKDTGVSPFYVYRLAHGKRTKTALGVVILNQLEKAAIINEVSQSTI